MKASVFVGTSLDGFIARLDGAYDFLPAGGDEPHVLGRHPLTPAPAGAVVEQMSSEPAEVISHLARRGIQHAYVDGGIAIQRFLEARLTITRVPVLIGIGIPLFGAIPRDIHLIHIATHQYASGLVKSEYEIGD